MKCYVKYYHSWSLLIISHIFNITITYIYIYIYNKNHVMIFIAGSKSTIWHNRCPLWVFDPTAAKTLRRGAFHPSSTEDTETTCGSLSVVSILASSPTAMDRDVKGGSINLWGTSTNNNMKNSWIQCQQKMWRMIGKLACNSATRFFVTALCDTCIYGSMSKHNCRYRPRR